MTRTVILLCASGCLLLAAGAAAQPADLEMRPSDRSRSEKPGALERDLYPYRPAVPDTIGFVAPLTKRTDSGQVGIAGWTVPKVPAGSRVTADPDNAGWLGFGVAAEWGSLPRRARD